MTVVTHQLKTWPEFFDDVVSGRKTFEVRRADRNYQVGDRLLLCEFVPETQKYTTRVIEVEVIYILSRAEGLMLPDDLCIMGIKLR